MSAGVRRIAAAAGLIALLALTACTSAPAAPTATSTASRPSSAQSGPDPSSVASSAGPVIIDGIGIEIHQNRPDYATRTLQLSITNERHTPITVLTARFSAPQFAVAAEWSKPTEVPAGLTRSLPVALPEAVCPAPGGTAELAVTFADAAAVDSAVPPHTVSAAPADPFGVLARIAGEDCLDEAVAGVATLALDEALEVTGSGPASVAHLTLRVARVPGTSGELTLERALPTILLQPVDGADWPLDTTLDATTDSAAITLDAIPARCDPHAIAEDKRGTVIPIELAIADGPAGTVHVSPDDALRLALYDYIAARCGFAVG